MVRSGSPFSIAPFSLLLFPLVLGVSSTTPGYLLSPYTIHTVILCLFLFLIWFREGSFFFQPVWTFLLMIIVFSFGAIRVQQENLVFPVLMEGSYCVLLDDYPGEKEKTYQVTGQLINSTHRILVYMPKTTISSEVRPGSILVFEGKPELIVNTGNPFEFDYHGYLEDKGIGYRAFLKEGKFYVSENPGSLNMFHRALIFRRVIIERLGSFGIKPDNVHLIGSISFGARDEVDKDTIRSFTNAGVIHVLAVSGMNIGLIYVVLDFFFRFLKSGHSGSIVHTLIMLSGIWCYTVIAGMSASILRAAVMFSFVTIGTLLRKNSSIYNSLSVSAFILIAIKPAIIRDVGFQLSYAALLSIVVIQPYLYKRLYFRNLLADKMWLLLSVTLAAQIGTLPFTLAYFHQFPVYFWLANLVVVPLVTVILYLSVALLFISLISSYMASVAGAVLDCSADLVTWTVRMVDKLPYSVVDGLYPTVFQMGLIGTAIFLLLRYHRNRKWILLSGVLFSAIVLAVFSGIEEFRQVTRSEIVFFNIPGTRALALTSGRQTMVLYDSDQKSEVSLKYHINPYLEGRGISEMKLYQLTDSLEIGNSSFHVSGNSITYRGFKVFLEPDKTCQPPGVPDLAWLLNDREGRALFSEYRNCRIILHKNGSYACLANDSLSGIKFFEMNRSVLLSFKPGSQTSPLEYSCNYFNSRD